MHNKTRNRTRAFYLYVIGPGFLDYTTPDRGFYSYIHHLNGLAVISISSHYFNVVLLTTTAYRADFTSYLRVPRTQPFSRSGNGVFAECRDRPNMPFRCLDAQYRRELVRVYLTNVETICRKFVDEKRATLATLREDSQGFRAFLGSIDPTRRRKLAKESGEVILKVCICYNLPLPPSPLTPSS
jgi:hypothetical protein